TDLRAGQQRAEVAALERVGRRRVAEALQRAAARPGPVGLQEEERLVLDDGPPQRGPPVLVVHRSLFRSDEAFGVESVVGQIAVGAGVELVRARLGRVLDEPSARMAVLGGIGRGDDRDLLDGFDGRRALLATLVAGGITEGTTVEEVLGGPCLAAVDARVELA